jgi:long-chain fatty acid transport protein
MLSIRKIVVAVCVLLAGFYGQEAFAASAGGYSIETNDAAVFGMGTAFVGEADTPAAVYYNPAGINQMTTVQISLGDAIIAPRGEMTQPGGNMVHEQNNEYNIPNFYAVVPVIAGKLTIGAGGGSYWGLGTNWGLNSPLDFATTQASITNLDNTLAASYQVTDKWSLAAGVINDFSKVDESYDLNNGGGTGGANGVAELKGKDDAWGYRIATLFKINDQNQVGLIYNSRINHNYSGKLSINGANPGIYGLSSFVAPVNLKTVLPQSVVLGYSFRPTSKWTINADLKWTDWSSTQYETINVTNPTLQALGVGAPTPENWHSVWTESIGAQYDFTNRFRVRLGYYHVESPVSNADFNPSIPDSNSNGYTTGFGFDITKRLTLDVAYSALVYDSRVIVNKVSNSQGGSVNGKYEEFVNIGLMSLTYKF